MQEGDVLRCQSSSDLINSAFVAKYFRLGDDLEHILALLSKGEVMTRAIQKFYGMRLVDQYEWECLASFVLATNANIPRIKKMVAAVSEKYGDLLEFDGEKFHAFPGPMALASASLAELHDCGLGYRAPFLRRVAASVTEGKVDFAEVASLPYLDARKELLKELFGEKILLGVGPKVADCVLLYSCGKDEAFPIDVWIAKALAKSFPKLLGPRLRSRLSSGGTKLSLGDYARISSSARAHFGRYAGFAQLYLYMAAREGE